MDGVNNLKVTRKKTDVVSTAAKYMLPSPRALAMFWGPPSLLPSADVLFFFHSGKKSVGEFS